LHGIARHRNNADTPFEMLGRPLLRLAWPRFPHRLQSTWDRLLDLHKHQGLSFQRLN
jgi:hypothetical protein